MRSGAACTCRRLTRSTTSAPGSSREWCKRGSPGSWNLLFFGVTAIAVALTLNIHNSVWGYQINLGVLALADTGLIFFVLVPGYMPLWPGLTGPILWVLGLAFTTLAYLHRANPWP